MAKSKASRLQSAGAWAADNAPANSVAPAITGTETVGQTLSLSDGTWSDTPDSYSYIWKRDGDVIAGETGNTYVLAAEDEGAVITATVVASNLGITRAADSNATGAIAAA